jgi:rubrerythrin
MSEDDLKQILEPFALALKLEEEGRQFFLMVAQKTKSRLARQTFEFLASEEDRHIEKIRKFYRSLELSEELPEIEDSDAETKLAAFNDRLAQLTEETNDVATDLQAYRTALEFENGAEELYAAKMRSTDNPRIKKLYRWLIEEEAMHGRLLRSCVKFVEDPTDWFDKRKSSS